MLEGLLVIPLAIGLTIVGMAPWVFFAWYTGYIGHRHDKH